MQMSMKLREEQFQNDWLTVLMIAQKEEFQKAYFECTHLESFKAYASDLIEKSKRIGQKVLTKEDKTGFVERVNAVLPDLLKLVGSSKEELDALVQSDAAIEIRLLTKAMVLMHASITAEPEWWKAVLVEKPDVIIYLGLKHFIAQIKTSKMAKTKKPWVHMMAMQYTESFWTRLRLDDVEGTYQTLLVNHETLEKESHNKDRIITAKKGDIAKLNEKVTDLSQKLNQKNKTTVLKEVERLEEQLAQLNEKHETACHQVSDLKSKLVQAEAYKGSLQKLNETTKALEQSHKQIETLKRALQESETQSKEWHGYNLMTHLSDYLEKYGMTLALSELMTPYLQTTVGMQSVVESPAAQMASDYFGFCEITGGVHYIVSLEGAKHVLREIPDDLYLGQGQIVLANAHNVFLESFLYRDAKGGVTGNSEKVVQMGLVVKGEVDGVADSTEGSGFMVELANEERCAFVNHTPYVYTCGCVVGLNANLEIVKAYDGIRFNVDLFMDSVVARHQKAYVVERVVGNTLIAREMPNGELKVIPAPEEFEDSVKTPCTLFVKNDQVVKCLKSVRFYTTSRGYSDQERGTVICESHGIFIERWNGEKRLLEGIPETTILKTGDQVVIDAYMHFVGKDYVCYDKPLSKPVQKKYKKDDSSQREVCQMRPERILIIGDEGMQQSYKLGLFKNGYCTEVVSGVDSWNKIAKAVRQSDVVVYVTDHAKHMHYYKYKEEFADKTTIYAACEGPNRIVALLDAQLNNA